jgi:hypothetical protein
VEHVWSVLCQTALESKRTNNVSLIETLERIVFRSDEADVEGFAIEFAFVTMWYRSDLHVPEEARARLHVVSPEEESLVQADYKVDLTERLRLRHTLYIRGMPYRVDGIYRFNVLLNVGKRWKRVASVPLEIRREPAQN